MNELTLLCSSLATTLREIGLEFGTGLDLENARPTI